MKPFFLPFPSDHFIMYYYWLLIIIIIYLCNLYQSTTMIVKKLLHEDFKNIESHLQ